MVKTKTKKPAAAKKPAAKKSAVKKVASKKPSAKKLSVSKAEDDSKLKKLKPMTVNVTFSKPKTKAAPKIKLVAKKDPAAEENSSETIDAQVEQFLASGKKIQEIPAGTSGINHTGGTKHITISRNKPQDQD